MADGISYTYNEATTSATTVTASNVSISSTYSDFYEINTSSYSVTATITKRPLKLTSITSITPAYQWGSASVSGTAKTSGTNNIAAFESGVDNEGLISSDSSSIEITFAGNYNDMTTSTATNGATVTMTSVELDSTNSANYDFSYDSASYTGTVTAQSISIKVTNPSQFGSTVTYGDTLDLTGMTVKVTYGSSTPITYTATQSGTTVTWNDGSGDVDVSGIFTYGWASSAADATSTMTPGETLSVSNHNGKYIKVISAQDSTATDVDSAVAISPKEIKSVIISGTIEKTYDGNTDLDADDTITYSTTDVIGSDNVEISATATYGSKNVGTSYISFKDWTVSNTTNYTISTPTSITGSARTGTISKKAVSITGIYVPTTFVDASASQAKTGTVTGAIYTSSASAANGYYTASGILSGETSYMTLTFDYSYDTTDLVSAGNPTVDITNMALSSSDGTNYPVSNYRITYLTEATGTVLADAYTGVEEVSPPTILTSDDANYTHGDSISLNGMSIKITTSSIPDGTTYTVTSGAWSPALPDGVSVKIGTVDVTTNPVTQAHYTNMNGSTGSKVVVTILTTSGSESIETTYKITVDKAALTATAYKATSTETAYTTTELTKTYDGTTALPSGVTPEYKVSGIQTFDDEDDVDVSVTAAYESASVAYSGDTVTTKAIKFTNISLTGDDAGNYTAPDDIADLTGQINPFAIAVSAISDTYTATYNDSSTISGELTTTNYTSNTLPSDGSAGTKPTIKYTYTFASVDSTGDQTVTISNIALATTDTNYTISYTGDDKTGTVSAANITSLSISTQPTTSYKYGDTLDLSGLVVLVNGSTYVTYGSNDWTAYGLSITDNIDGVDLANGNTMYTAYNGKTLTVIGGDKSAAIDSLTVIKRKVYVKAEPASTVTKIYDGNNTVDQAISFTLADAGEYDGVAYYNKLDGDDGLSVSTVDANTDYIYSDANVANNISLTYSGTLTVGGTNSGEYDVTIQSLTGAITSKTVTITPVFADIYQNLFASNEKELTPTSYNYSGLVGGDTEISGVSYTGKISVDDQKGTGAKTLTTVSASPTAGATSGNYTIAWADATVNVLANAPASISVKTQPTKLDSYIYGDTIDLSGLVVTVEYTDGTTHDFTYGTDDYSDFTIALSNNKTTDKVLTTNDNGTTIDISLTSYPSVTKVSTSAITVGQKTLTLTANGTPSKTYDSTTAVESGDITSISVSGAADGDTVSAVTTGMSATYDNKNVGTGKTVTISGVTISATNGNGDDVSDQYTYSQPADLTNGEITVLEITVSNVTIPEVLVGSTGSALTVTPTYNLTPSIYSGDTVNISATASYIDAQSVSTPDVSWTMQITGVDASNYSFNPTSGTAKGSVVSDTIESITVGGSVGSTYTHGDALSLDGISVTLVSKKGSVDGEAKLNGTYTYTAADGWKRQLCV